MRKSFFLAIFFNIFFFYEFLLQGYRSEDNLNSKSKINGEKRIIKYKMMGKKKKASKNIKYPGKVIF